MADVNKEKAAARKLVEDAEAAKRAEAEEQEKEEAAKGVRVAILDQNGKFVIKENKLNSVKEEVVEDSTDAEEPVDENTSDEE